MWFEASFSSGSEATAALSLGQCLRPAAVPDAIYAVFSCGTGSSAAGLSLPADTDAVWSGGTAASSGVSGLWSGIMLHLSKLQRISFSSMAVPAVADPDD